MTLTNGPIKVAGKVEGTGAVGWVVNHTGESAIAQLRYRLKDIKFSSAEAAFKVGDKSFNAGSYVIKADGNPADAAARIAKEAGDLGLTVTAVDRVPEVAAHAIGTPRIAFVHTWINTQNEGWYRIEFDRLGIPYEYISDQNLAKVPNLRDKYDVIILGPVGGNAQNIVRGQAKLNDKEGPIPWKKSDLTPNMGMSPDTTDDIRGGMGILGIAKLTEFVEAGGLFVTIGNNADIAIDYGITTGVSIQDARLLKARGSVLNAVFADRGSPISYGYDAGLAVYFNQAPLLNVGGGFGGPGGGGAGGGAVGERPSGRGSFDDPDIPQGRKPDYLIPAIPPDRAALALQPGPETRPRVVLRFAPEKELFVSGMLAGGVELAGKPAVLDVPVGKGHVVMFANNPMWRHETHGSFSLLWNAILNFDNLGVGRLVARPGATPAGEDEYQNDDH